MNDVTDMSAGLVVCSETMSELGSDSDVYEEAEGGLEEEWGMKPAYSLTDMLDFLTDDDQPNIGKNSINQAKTLLSTCMLLLLLGIDIQKNNLKFHNCIYIILVRIPRL